ncbi:MAG: hypothetical protein AAGE43_11540 [Pseudomonadota bacterium]
MQTIKGQRMSNLGRHGITGIACLMLAGCITFGAAENVETKDRILRQFETMKSAAEAAGVDVDAVLTENETADSDLDDDVNNRIGYLLRKASGLAGSAEQVADASLRLEQENFSDLNEAALIRTALLSFEDDLQEFGQAAAWLTDETQRLVQLDREILALEGYTDCGGSELGTAKCVTDVLANATSMAAFAGISIPGGQLFAPMAATFAVAAEVDKQIQRQRLFDERRRRIQAIEYIATGSLRPAFENLRVGMITAMAGLPEDLRPPDWERQLAAAEQGLDRALGFAAGIDGRLDRLKDGGLEEADAFEAIWEGAHEMITGLGTGLEAVTATASDMRSLMNIKRSPMVDANGDAADFGVYRTTLMRRQGETLLSHEQQMADIERELASLLPNYRPAESYNCPVAL